MAPWRGEGAKRPGSEGRLHQALIGELYAVEREVLPPGVEDSQVARLTQRARLRAERSRPLMERIRAWAESQTALPRSGLSQAIRYMQELWLTRFLDDPLIPLDNNPVERALRGLVVGRKNHYGSRSRRGCEVAALFYSLIETAKICGAEPKSYLLRATSEALDTPRSLSPIPDNLSPRSALGPSWGRARSYEASTGSTSDLC